MNENLSDSFSRAVRRAGQEPFFLASIFQLYQAVNDVDDSELANLLGCAIQDIPRLSLCRRPKADTLAFAADIDHLARRFQVDAQNLASVVRQVDALEALRTHLAATMHVPEILRAAKDRDEGATRDDEDDRD